MEWIGWIGIVVAVLFGVVAWLQGHAAGRRAKGADEKAERLEKRFTALAGDVETVKGAAVQTRQLAEDANKISRDALMGVQESHDVEWRGDWEGESYVLTNIGRDEALNVRGSITINQSERRFDTERIGPGEEVRLDFAEVVRQCAKEARERRARSRGGPFGAYPTYEPAGLYDPYVWIRVLWKSQGGVAHEHNPHGYADNPLKQT